MAGNPFDNPTMSMMYQDALQSLYAGAVMPWERDILAIAPLPADVIDPFASQDVDPLQIMGFAYNSLVTWIDEAKKANYFSKRFTDLSKLVLKGVMTMGRGLITLHKRGEDLSRAPMQIGDLISVGSYHFRKSYLGVIQTAKSHPEISERLLLNQLSWTNMLLRLYKTKEKLEKPISGVRGQVSGVSNQVSGIRDQVSGKQLGDGDADNSSLLPLHSSLDNGSSCDNVDANPFSEVDALFEPAALSAPRALTSLEGNKKPETSENKKSEIRNKKLNSGNRDQVSGVRSQISGISGQGSEAHGDCPHVVAKSTHGTVTSDALIPANEEEAENKKSETTENKKSEIRNKKSNSGISGQVSGVSSNEEERMKNEESEPDGVETENAKPVSDIITNEKEKTREDELPDGNDDSSFLLLHSSLGDDLPPCLQILRNAFGRSEPNDEGRLTFTYDEIRYLASDPDFARIYPDAAADMRKIQMQIDTG